MSMTVEIKVNGELIHHLYIVNRGSTNDPYQPDERRYEWSSAPSMIAGEVTHCRDDGAFILVSRVAEAAFSTLAARP